jgi:hypothetical protein
MIISAFLSTTMDSWKSQEGEIILIVSLAQYFEFRELGEKNCILLEHSFNTGAVRNNATGILRSFAFLILTQRSAAGK